MKKIVKNHCCIPPKVENKARWDGYDSYDQIKGDKGYVFKGNSLDTFTKKPWKASKKPWYFLTKEESITINNRHKPIKRTAADNLFAWYENKYEKWLKKNPQPTTPNLFYDQFAKEWLKEEERFTNKMVTKWRDFIEPKKHDFNKNKYLLSNGMTLSDALTSLHNREYNKIFHDTTDKLAA